MTPPDAAAPGRGQTGELELFLLELRYRAGRLTPTEGNRPFLLSDASTAWVVYTGHVNLFAVPTSGGQVAGPRRHLLRSGPGSILLGMDVPADGLGLLACGTAGASMVRLPLARLHEFACELEYRTLIGALVDDWIAGLSAAIASTMAPRASLLIEAGRECTLKSADAATPQKGVVWVRPLQGQVVWQGRPGLTLPANLDTPLGPTMWLRADEPSLLHTVDTVAAMALDPAWAGMAAFHQLVLAALTLDQAQAECAAREHVRDWRKSEQRALDGAVDGLSSLLMVGPSERLAAPNADRSSPLLDACRWIAVPLHFEVRNHRSAVYGNTPEAELNAIARASGVRVRRVALKGNWRCGDHGPLLAFQQADGLPVALMPVSARRYELRDPVALTRETVTAGVAERLAPFAFSFYMPFPRRALRALDLFNFGGDGSAPDRIAALLCGLALGLVALFTPLATGYIFDSILPAADRAQLMTIGAALALAAMATSALLVARSIALLRLEGRLSMLTEAAIWDRLLSLPATFFRGYTAGDLAVRAMGINTIRRTLSGSALSTALTALFSLFTLALLFSYELRLALAATALIALSIGATLLSGMWQLRYQRQLVEQQGKLAGTVLQIINGIAKFRVAGAEARAFALWARAFSAQKRLAFRARRVRNGLAVFDAAYPLLTSAVVFAMLGLSGRAGLSTGQFLGFNVAFSQLLGTGLALSATLLALISMAPVYERARPILQTLPEFDEARAHPGELRGDLEVSHVSFRYHPGGPLILNDVSLRAKAGEFVALVGPSGSGKSTLFRLLLGFETPEAGAVLYDGHELAGLDLHAVRRQLGVVMQSARLLTGDIVHNIIGSAPLTLDDAWEAARLSGLDEDIRQMPMGMHTLISEGGSTFSGGQRQRLLIARAIVHRPRILLFDEATSALDNRTQEIVSRSLEQLKATRVVIAHRLSTIMHADRIYVVDDGRIVQRGTYAELVNQPGLFADLARRQSL